MKRLIIIATLAALTATSLSAVTVSSTNVNNVTATVTGGCQWTTPLTMAFGAYDPFAGAALTQVTSVSFRCVRNTNGTNTYRVWFNKTGGNMLNGANTLAYTLTNNAFAPLPTTIATSAVVAGVAGVGVGAGYSYTVRGSVAAGQDAVTGAYQDTVIANIEY